MTSKQNDRLHRFGSWCIIGLLAGVVSCQATQPDRAPPPSRGPAPTASALSLLTTDGFEKDHPEVFATIQGALEFAQDRLPCDSGRVEVLVIGPDRPSAERLVRKLRPAETPDGPLDSDGQHRLDQAMSGEGDFFLSGYLDPKDPFLQLVFISPQIHDDANPRAFGQIVVHEYTHVYQMSWLRGLPAWPDVTDAMGPAWYVEGMADYLSWCWACEEGWMGSRGETSPLHAEMDRRMDGALELVRAHSPLVLEQSEGRSREDVGRELGPDSQGPLFYWMGSWAIAWLVDLAGRDAVIDEFYRHLAERGWSQAFEQSFGMSTAEFHRRFRDFLILPRAEQLAILPPPSSEQHEQ